MNKRSVAIFTLKTNDGKCLHLDPDKCSDARELIHRYLFNIAEMLSPSGYKHDLDKITHSIKRDHNGRFNREYDFAETYLHKQDIVINVYTKLKEYRHKIWPVPSRIELFSFQTNLDDLTDKLKEDIEKIIKNM